MYRLYRYSYRGVLKKVHFPEGPGLAYGPVVLDCDKGSLVVLAPGEQAQLEVAGLGRQHKGNFLRLVRGPVSGQRHFLVLFLALVNLKNTFIYRYK